MPSTFRLGMNARLFPNNWRPVTQDIGFAHRAGFQALQLPGSPEGLAEHHLGAPFREVADAMRRLRVEAVMEILLPLGPHGRAENGKTPDEVLEANLPAILELGMTHVHWHLVPRTGGGVLPELLEALPEVVERGLGLAREHGFVLGLEHNAPGMGLLDDHRGCRALLDLFPDLGFVFDLNHAPPGQVEGYLALAARMTLLHLSDTPLPQVNWHLPVGSGSVDFGADLHRLRQGGFRGLGILEIGGQPWSGGYGQDTDAALLESAGMLQHLLEDPQTEG